MNGARDGRESPLPDGDPEPVAPWICRVRAVSLVFQNCFPLRRAGELRYPIVLIPFSAASGRLCHECAWFQLYCFYPAPLDLYNAIGLYVYPENATYMLDCLVEVHRRSDV